MATISNSIVPQPDIQFLEEIGSGSFGIVQKALIYGQICAVKRLIRLQQLQDWKTLEVYL